ncbi:MAG TPA: succinylglutamate desuccinylase/aspartoacylase family protein [Longimicrobiales bacterium]|nr:succinylglutamate desuccinylase/aspartoacylase family protein [Longimicrobiales bacterium]
MNSRPPLRLGGKRVRPGERKRVELPVARITTGDWLALSVEVLHGRGPGPTLWLTGAIHGDEIDGIEIIRRILTRLDTGTLNGTIIAVPVVNLFGFVSESRYLPDRRDLNRSFPGSTTGSLAARLARMLMDEVVARGDWGLDFHCGSDKRENLPQVRADLDDDETRRIARVFGAPVTIHGRAPDGALRKAALEADCRTLVYEAGEAGRFTESAIRRGVDGVARVLRTLGMTDGGAGLAPGTAADTPPATVESRRTRWVRAARSGICRIEVELGQRVRKGQAVGEITDPFGDGGETLAARCDGIVIGRRVNPLVYQGEAVVHLAEVDG